MVKVCRVLHLIPGSSDQLFRIGFATASVEGRIAVEYFDPSPEVQEKRYAFKCHRQTINDVDHVWPVNALAFHPMYVCEVTAAVNPTLTTFQSDITHLHLQGPMVPFPYGTTNSKSACDCTKNIILLYLLLTSIATGPNWRLVSAITGMMVRKGVNQRRDQACLSGRWATRLR